MARPLRIEYPGAVYHVTCRGNERRTIFTDDADRNAFLSFLGEAVDRFKWILTAYVLMSNHFHLVISLTAETLARGMQWLNTRYAAAFNRSHERVGHLFQGRYHAPIVDTETYMLEVLRYVVLNPVRADIVAHPGEYAWSSYRATAGETEAPEWLATDDVLALFGDEREVAATRYARFVEEGIGSQRAPWDDLVGQIYLGGDEWRETVRQKVELRPRGDEHPRVQREIGGRSMAEVVSSVATAFGVEEGKVRMSHGGAPRMIAAWLGSYEAGLPLTSIAAGLRLRSRTQASRLVRECSESLERDGSLIERVQVCIDLLHRAWKSDQREV